MPDNESYQSQNPDQGYTPNPSPNPSPNPAPNGSIPGKGAATASLVLGIIGVVCWFFSWSSIASIILGIIGIVLAGNSKKAGFEGGTRKAGMVLSIIALVGGAVFFVTCVICASTLALFS